MEKDVRYLFMQKAMFVHKQGKIEKSAKYFFNTGDVKKARVLLRAARVINREIRRIDEMLGRINDPEHPA